MARHRNLKLQDLPDSGRTLPFVRIAAGLGVLVALGLVVLQVGGRVLEDEPELPAGDADAAVALAEPETASDAPELRLRALANVRTRVELDGEIVFDGTLLGGTDRRWTAGRVTAVELDDLTRATVHYDGQRVEPLGSLATARRLEFVDDL
jgi:hypothetical protein